MITACRGENGDGAKPGWACRAWREIEWRTWHTIIPGSYADFFPSHGPDAPGRQCSNVHLHSVEAYDKTKQTVMGTIGRFARREPSYSDGFK